MACWETRGGSSPPFGTIEFRRRSEILGAFSISTGALQGLEPVT